MKESLFLFSGATLRALPDLALPLKAEYFDDIVAGRKPEEFRLATDYWRKRLVGREYGRIVLMRGYPKRDDHERRLIRPWRGLVMRTITHPHFGPEPVEVFAIAVGDTKKTPHEGGRQGRAGKRVAERDFDNRRSAAMRLSDDSEKEVSNG
ncbi:hypothetical protein [Paraburkholderia dioscoreae]|uniref:RNA-binding protein n=1 Tax=Paraburkholderia dioscoreae TaxID=2604047 RepID=A0A5Q4ZEI8_9BURK|nr:conserved protein of unknown function [Paraburkholderia dioscoreae]